MAGSSSSHSLGALSAQKSTIFLDSSKHDFIQGKYLRFAIGLNRYLKKKKNTLLLQK